MSAVRNTISPSTRGQNQTAVGAARRAARPTVTFGEIAFNSVAKKKPTPDDVSHYIGLEHLDPENFEVTRWGSDVAPVGEKLLMKKGDLLFGKRRAYQRKVAIAPFDGIFSAHGMVLRPNEKVIDKDFFPFFIASDAFLSEAIRISVGGLSPTINWKDLKVLEFSLLPLAEQKKLAEELWAMERVKRAYKKLLAETDRLVEARFVEMFGSRNDIAVQIGEIAERVTKGTTPTSIGFNFENDGVNFVKIENITTEGEIVRDKLAHISPQCNHALLRSQLQVGDILFSIAGAIGRVAVVPKEILPANTNQALAIIRLKREAEIDLKFLLFALNSRFVKDQYYRLKQGVAQVNLSLKNISELSIPLPPLSLQREFAAFVGRAEKAKESLKGALKALTAAQKAKMNAAFRG